MDLRLFGPFDPALRPTAQLAEKDFEVQWRPQITHSFREGDIRHCTADTMRLERTLGFRPRVEFKDGVRDLVAWVKHEQPRDRVELALGELKERGVIR